MRRKCEIRKEAAIIEEINRSIKIWSWIDRRGTNRGKKSRCESTNTN